ncbi:MAG: DUF1573 domain-containing protein [Phycisphaerales bacterium]|nr:DUF1573 domain-containing protein [Phycisphaerales bacterium]
MITCLFSLAVVALVFEQPTPPPEAGAIQDRAPSRIVRGELKCLRLANADPENAGRVQPMRPFVRRVEYVNVSDERLSLQLLERSCSCTSVAFSAETVNPGGHVTISITVVPAGTLGDQTQSVTLNVCDATGTKVRETALLAVRYTPDIQVEADPTSLWPTAPAGAPVKARVLLSQDASFSFDVHSLQHDSLTGSVSDAIELPESSNDRAYCRWVDFTLVAPDAPGNYVGWIRGGEKVDDRSPLVMIVRLRSEPVLVAEPPSIVMASPAERFIFHVKALEKGKGLPGTLHATVEPADAPLTVRVRSEAEGGWTVEVVAEVKQGSVGGCRIVLSGDRQLRRPLLSVPVAWWLR